MEKEINRIVNIRYKVYKYEFDAAVDCNFALHDYEYFSYEKLKNVPIELYNYTEDWDIKVIIATSNDFNNKKGLDCKEINFPNSSFSHTFVPLELIIEETKKWIAENNCWYGFWYRLFRFFKSPLKKHQ